MLHLSEAWLLPQANADPSVINCLHNLSRRIATVLQHEERRCQYLTREAKLILALQDEVSAVADGECSRRLSYPASQSRHVSRQDTAVVWKIWKLRCSEFHTPQPGLSMPQCKGRLSGAQL